MRHYRSAKPVIGRLATGIEGFDFVANGGLPVERATLVSGTTGSGKTMFATQFLVEGAKRGEAGVFVTFEESPNDIRRNVQEMGWDIRPWEQEGLWTFVDVSPRPVESVVVGNFDLGGLLTRIENAVNRVNAKRLSIDSIGAIFAQLGSDANIRNELFRLFSSLKSFGVTSIVTAERLDEYGPISLTGVEEFVTDNVIIFRNSLQDEIRRRTLEILKFRGTFHHKGEFPFTMVPGEGIAVIPLSSLRLNQGSSKSRISCGNGDVDAMCGGGYFQDSVTLISGATGTGKTLMACEFLAEARKEGQRAMLFGFEESRDQIFRNAQGWGMDFETMEAQGMLRVVSEYPETMGLEDHLIAIKRDISEFGPSRIAVDSLSALERASTIKSFREFVIALTAFTKKHRIATIFTSATSALVGGTSITEAHISTITDAIVLLRYVELHGEMKRGITILKMRGSRHDKDIREYSIDGSGMHVHAPFRNVSGILSGAPSMSMRTEMDRLGQMFHDQ